MLLDDRQFRLPGAHCDLQSYERFLADKLTRIRGVANIQSSITLKQVVYSTELPLGES